MSIGCPEVSQHSPHDVRLNQRSKITGLDACAAQAERTAATRDSPDSFMLLKHEHTEKPWVCRAKTQNEKIQIEFQLTLSRESYLIFLD